MRGITTNILRILTLVDSHPVDIHADREPQILEVLLLEARRHAQIHDNIL